MKTIFFVILVFFLSSCNGNQLAYNIDKGMIAISGNKPPTSFQVANLQTMKDYVFNMNDYTIAMPGAKEKDFTLSYKWQGRTYYNKKIGLNLYNDKGYAMYGISVTASKVFEYGERERALENNNIQYIRSKIKIDNSDKLYIKQYGKENYLCQVMEYKKIKYPNKQYVGYRCYKFNKDRTKAKYVSIRLTYNKPTNPTLAKQYTYADLKRRAKRMLDSLYIKDEW